MDVTLNRSVLVAMARLGFTLSGTFGLSSSNVAEIPTCFTRGLIGFAGSVSIALPASRWVGYKSIHSNHKLLKIDK